MSSNCMCCRLRIERRTLSQRFRRSRDADRSYDDEGTTVFGRVRVADTAWCRHRRFISDVERGLRLHFARFHGRQGSRSSLIGSPLPDHRAAVGGWGLDPSGAASRPERAGFGGSGIGSAIRICITACFDHASPVESTDQGNSGPDQASRHRDCDPEGAGQSAGGSCCSHAWDAQERAGAVARCSAGRVEPVS